MNEEAEQKRWSDIIKLVQQEHDWELKKADFKVSDEVEKLRQVLTVLMSYSQLHEEGIVQWREMMALRESMEDRIKDLIPDIKTLIR